MRNILIETILKMERDNNNFGNYSVNLRFLLNHHLINKKDKILEIGSGKGHILNTLRNKGFNVIGVELSQEFVNEIKNQYGDRLSVIKIEDERLPFPDGSFDKVISFDVLEHIPDTDLHLQEVRRVLRNNGLYCFGIPNRLVDEPFCIWAYKSFTKYKKPGEHCSLHTYCQIRRRLRKNGFKEKFFSENQDTPWLRRKVKYFFGKIGIKFLDIINLNRFPNWLKPTLYVVGEKKKV